MQAGAAGAGNTGGAAASCAVTGAAVSQVSHGRTGAIHGAVLRCPFVMSRKLPVPGTLVPREPGESPRLLPVACLQGERNPAPQNRIDAVERRLETWGAKLVRRHRHKSADPANT